MAHRSPLWLAIRLPELSLFCHALAPDSPEPVIVSDYRRVCTATQAALDQGVERGMPVSTARLVSGARVIERDRQLEQQRLTTLAGSLYRFTPHIEPYVLNNRHHTDQAGLLLELSSCLRLFDGIEKLLGRIDEALRQQQLGYRAGLAPVGRAAWLLSWDQGDTPDNPMAVCLDHWTGGNYRERLRQLPVTLLQEFPEAVDSLEKTGFATLGDIFRQIENSSLAAFRKRLGHDFADYIADILAIDDFLQQPALFSKPVATFQPLDTFADQIQFDYPVAQVEQLREPLAILLQSLTAWLVQQQLQCQTLYWHFQDIGKNRHCLTVSCEGVHSRWQLAFDLTLIQLEQQPLPFEVDVLALTAAGVTPAVLQNGTMRLPGRTDAVSANSDWHFIDRHLIDRDQLATTLARLSARLGEEALFRISYRDANIPEQAATTIAIGEAPEQYLRGDHASTPRPQWLLDPPVAIGKGRGTLYWQGKIELLQGPERIEGSWWQQPVARDYYIGCRDDNLRLWLFRDLLRQQWYVQGIFS